MYSLFIEPFAAYQFMYKTLFASLVLSILSAPLGVFLILRRMSLMGEALSHGILPGIAVMYLLFGLSPFWMCFGAVIAGLVVLGLSHFLKNKTHLYEDASFTGLYLVSLALGVLILSYHNSGLHLLHLLFGSSLSVDDAALSITLSLTPIGLIVFLFIYKVLVLESFDPGFAKQRYPYAGWFVWLYMGLLIITIVASYQILGVLLALGMMMLPAIAGRLLFCHLTSIMIGSAIIAMIGVYVGLLLAYHMDLAAGPAILCVYGLFIVMGFLKSYHKKNKYPVLKQVDPI